MLTDPRVKRLAELLVHYSLALQPDDLFVIGSSTVALPLIEECYRQALLAGAHPLLNLQTPGQREIFLRTATDRQLDYISDVSRYYVERADALLNILADTNTRALTHIDPAKVARTQAAGRDLTRTFLERDHSGALRWSIAMFPNDAHAQDAEMSLDELADFVFGACLLNEDDPIAAWQALQVRQATLIDRLQGKREVRIVGPDTDLTLSIAGRIFLNDDGRKNMPGGEIFTGPVENSAEGTIRYTYPVIYGGKEVVDVRLRFVAGEVVEASAAKNEELIHSLLAMDEGAKRLGEFAFGTNASITSFTRNILFDEKIGGTVHLALGAGLPATGSVNQSALHWDMICDLRDGGEVYVDGDLFLKNGRFVD